MDALQEPRRLRSAFKLEEAGASGEGLDELLELPAGQQMPKTRQQRGLKQASRMLDSEDAGDEVADDDDGGEENAEVCRFPHPSL